MLFLQNTQRFARQTCNLRKLCKLCKKQAGTIPAFAHFPLQPSTMQIGPFTLPNRLFVAPMAGVTDRPFRALCRQFGAGYAVSEMVTSRRELWQSRKTSLRADYSGEPAPVAVQIAGTSPQEMADAARWNIDRGAQIIDINMGCPAKKVCSKWAGSALMQNEALAAQIMQAVVAACAPHNVPVTLKIRTGWSCAHRNAPSIAQIAQDAGIALVAVHGRSREQGYTGAAEYDTAAAIKAALRIPVAANGDIDSPTKAAQVLAATGADALMIGRAALGRPWIFREIACFLSTGKLLEPPTVAEVRQTVQQHLLAHHAFYSKHGNELGGVRSARKHIGWYVASLPNGAELRQRINQIDCATTQVQVVDDWFASLQNRHNSWPCPDSCPGATIPATSATSATSATLLPCLA